jgi:hypothetical protein
MSCEVKPWTIRPFFLFEAFESLVQNIYYYLNFTFYAVALHVYTYYPWVNYKELPHFGAEFIGQYRFGNFQKSTNWIVALQITYLSKRVLIAEQSDGAYL